MCALAGNGGATNSVLLPPEEQGSHGKEGQAWKEIR